MREEREVGKKRRFRRLLGGSAAELKLQGFWGDPLEPSVGILAGIFREGRKLFGISGEEPIEGLARERKNRLLRVRLRGYIGRPDSLGTI